MNDHTAQAVSKEDKEKTKGIDNLQIVAACLTIWESTLNP